MCHGGIAALTMNSPQLPPLPPPIQSPSLSTATTSSFSLTPAESQLPYMPSTTAPALPASSIPKSPNEVVAALKKKDTSKGVKYNTKSSTRFSLQNWQFFFSPISDSLVVRFRAIGNAPIMKQNFFKINASNKFQAVIQFLRKELNYKGSDPLFLYINSAFSPAPDEIVSNLHKVSHGICFKAELSIICYQISLTLAHAILMIQCFNTDGHLIINYCTSAAWG
ncbi:ubiquitin-like autophagy protein Apg12-domain-containing protein [Endogone sp. FLAS-F59071]|nr:ubiquitin-like autophagy protein Apg12-domain-containing protein [Endogone sp. FLAS-F59071]|eukprot:RUS22882.1 ubiquitin-like autophagy protein Apg12-domain-containing protein [Endogone sp. FLAS-F59071]